MPSESPATSVLDVALLPSLIEPDSLQGHTVVVVDVLRATTTITHALFNGALAVLPQPSVAAARAAFEGSPHNALIGGERQGKIVDGFHHGNSPLEYTSDVIGGKSLILATTNGTVAMERCRSAERVLIGAMVNLDAIAAAALEAPLVTVVCSGTDRKLTSEDVIFAGALVERIQSLRSSAGLPTGQRTDAASLALNHWESTQQAIAGGKPLEDFFRTARGGINLVRIGHDADVVFAAQINRVPIVPELDVQSWRITS